MNPPPTLSFDDPRLADIRARIEQTFADRSRLGDPANVAAVEAVLAALDAGTLRVASPPSAADASNANADWTVHAWIKEAILLYFAIRKMETIEHGPLEVHDKIPLKRGLAAAGVRAVAGAVIRYGSFVERGAVVLPGFVNVGARVGAGTMVDTWATVGSCAQIGRDVHLAGGVGIGGVLEPAGARPVIVEDGAFIGSRVVVVEGVRVGEGAIIGAGVVLTASTTIIDVRGSIAVESKGAIPPRAVVIPGVRPKRFPAGEFGVPCALIVGERSASNEKKVSLEAALREFDVPV
jgi:2,3,4,5-tetrahydropyridine-2-carboxylate N-succinyltransferase